MAHNLFAFLCLTVKGLRLFEANPYFSMAFSTVSYAVKIKVSAIARVKSNIISGKYLVNLSAGVKTVIYLTLPGMARIW